MSKTSPDRLAAALRANLKRRKGATNGAIPPEASPKAGKDPSKSVEKADPPPPAKG